MIGCIVFFAVFVGVFLAGCYAADAAETKKYDPTTQVSEAIQYLNAQSSVTSTNQKKIQESLTTIFVFLKLVKQINHIASVCDEVLLKWMPHNRK